MLSELKIALGTVQLGLDYGIANKIGKPTLENSLKIIKTAKENGIVFFDTAQGYGNSEEVLGYCFEKLNLTTSAKIVSKLAPCDDYNNINQTILSSLAKLKIPSLWGYMLHNENMLKSWDNGLGEKLISLKNKGLIKNLGVSVYSVSKANEALDNPDIKIIQVPANIFDRRMAKAGIFQKAKDLNKTVFVRSIYLQGLVMLKDAPKNVPYGQEAIDAYNHFCQENSLNKAGFAMAYAKNKSLDSYLVIGAETANQIDENCKIFKNNNQYQTDLFLKWDNIWQDDIEDLICPTNWGNK